MKVLFVNPSLRPSAPHRFIPVGLGYVVTSARDAGFEFDLLDIDIGDYDDGYVERYIRDHSYDVIALGSIVTHYKWIKWFTKMVREHQPDCRIVLGNSVGSSIVDVVFANMPTDVVVLGEGDVTILDVLRAVRDDQPFGHIKEPAKTVPGWNGPNFPPMYEGTGIPGIAFRDDHGRIIYNGRRKAERHIDDFPFPDWDLFDVEQYIQRSRAYAPDSVFFPKDQARVLPINTARGCVFKCTFCHYVFWHDPYRHRSAQNILGEIERNIKKYDANYFRFWDELSFHKLGPAEKFVDALINAGVRVHWTAAVRSDLFGSDDAPYEDRVRVAGKFKEAGCLHLGYSLESGNDHILEAMNKRIKSDYFSVQVNLLRDAGIISNTSLIFGYPQEDKETIANTMRMCESLRIYPSVGFLLPLPETGMWRYALEHGHITDPEKFLSEMTERQDIVLNMTKMSDDEMLGEVTRWLAHLNEKFGRNLDPDKLIKTGGSANHNKHQVKEVQQKKAFALNMANAQGVPEMLGNWDGVSVGNDATAAGVPENC